MDALQLAAGNVQVARLLGAAGQKNGVEVLLQIFDGNVDADVSVRDERRRLRRPSAPCGGR